MTTQPDYIVSNIVGYFGAGLSGNPSIAGRLLWGGGQLMWSAGLLYWV